MRIAPRALVALLVALAAAAEPGPRAARSEMEEIYRLSGLDAQLGALDSLVAASLASNLERVPAAQAGVIRRAVQSEWSGTALQQQVAGRLEQVHHPQHAAATLRWLRSPLGRRVTQLDTGSSTAEGVRALEEFARQLTSQPPPATRLAFARELDRAVGATDFAVELSLASARAAMSAIGGALPAERRLDPRQIEAAIAAQRERLQAELAPIALVSTLYAHRNLSDADLEACLAFARGDAGRWYHGVVKQALLEVLTDAARRTGESVATALRTAPAPGSATSPAQRAD